jgi:hypothetical protein
MLQLRYRSLLSPVLAIATTALIVASADAGQRRFAFSYPTTTSPKGSIELENWVTFKHAAGEGKDLNAFEFKHELEFGVTDHLQISIYPANWSYNSADPERTSRYDETAIEAVYNLTDPTTSFLGSAIYLEVAFGEKAFDIEGKLLLEKNLGPWTVSYNAVLEAEWEGEKFGSYQERNGEFQQTVGIAYDITKGFSVGAELVHEVELPNWGDSEGSFVYAGPNISVRSGRAFATIAALFQLTGEDEEPDLQTRLIFGYQF